MEKKLGKRLKKFVKDKNIRLADMAANLDVTYQSASNLVTGRNYPKVQSMILLSEHYPELNLHWLITGNGSMLLGDDDSKVELDSMRMKVKKVELEKLQLNEMIEAQKQTISALTQLNEVLKSKNPS